MTAQCAERNVRCAYEIGHWADEILLRPGGLDLTAHAVILCNLQPGARVLDVGCGSGASARYLQQTLGFDVLGIDTSLLFDPAQTERLGKLRFIQASAECIPLKSSSLDLVLSECTLSLVAKKAQALLEFRRLLRPGGWLVITDMYARAHESISSIRALPETCFSGLIVREELEAELTAAGFRLDVWEDHSLALKRLLARFIFQHGGVDQLWMRGGTQANESACIRQIVNAVRPGYFLLAARKQETNGGEQQ